MSDDDPDDGRDEGLDDEDHGRFEAWLTRGISDSDAALVARFPGLSVPDREPTGANPWLSRGPANIAGRVRALCLDPDLAGGRPRAIYAGAASGGVFRTLDDGASWQSIWSNDRPAQAIGALACGSTAAGRTLWVGTGEKDKFAGDGVWRARLPHGADDPIDWKRAGTFRKANAAPRAADDMAGTDDDTQWPTAFEAAAVDPDDPNVCWFVGPAGVYRCKEDPANTFTWARWHVDAPAAGRRSRGCADVAFVHTTHGKYVVLAGIDTSWGDLILIPNPAANEATIQGVINAAVLRTVNPGAGPGPNLALPMLPAGAAPPFADPPQRCVNARIAIVPDAAGDRIYVIYANADPAPHAVQFHGLCASTIGAGPAWVAAGNWPQPMDAATQTLLTFAAFRGNRQAQGDYNLFLVAQAGAAADLVAWGMLDVFVSVNAGVTFTRSLDWLEYDAGDFGQHADQHAAAFAPGPLTLWVANDGGVTRSAGFLDAAGAPRAAREAGWRRSVAGLVCAQAYDLSASAVLPDVSALALQDIGGWIDGGGGAWRHIQGGDGLSTVFDPDDPHHMIVTWQGTANTVFGCESLRFEGGLGLDDASNRGIDRLLSRGVTPHRTLARGIVPEDRATSEDTVAHPTRPGRLLHIRERRLYISDDGEQFHYARLGDRFELFARLVVPATPAAGQLAGLIVRIGGPVALRLGFMPSETSDLAEGGADARTDYRVRVPSASGGHDDPGSAGSLDITVEICTGDAAAPRRFERTFPIDFPAQAYTWEQILARFEAFHGPQPGNWTPIGGGAAQPLPGGVEFELWGLPGFGLTNTMLTGVEITSRAVGADVDLEVSGNAAAKLLLQTRRYRGRDGRPAVVTTNTTLPNDPVPAIAARDVLEVQPFMTAGQPRHPAGAQLSYSFSQQFYASARPLARGLAGKLAGTGLRAWPITVTKYVRLRVGRLRAAGFTPFDVDPGSSALPGLARGAPLAVLAGRLFVDLKPLQRRYNLTPAAAPVRLTLVIGGAHRDIDFDPALLGGLTGVTAEEVARVIDDALNADPAQQTDITVEVQRDIAVDSVYEVSHSPVDPDVVWVGGSNHVWVSTDDGTTWADRYPTTDVPWINTFVAEAITADPFPPHDPANPEYTALVGARTALPTLARFSSRGGAAALPGIPLPAGYEGQAGQQLRIYALEADPRRRNTYYAGTELGVYRSTDGGSSWSAFSVGLPHVPALDLALDAGTDTLRAAMFGRGMYEHFLGDGAPALPEVWLRANTRDAGRRPVVHGDQIAGDLPVRVDAAHSPDITLTTLPAAAVAPPPLDVNELEDVPPEPARRGAVHQIAVRVRNRRAVAVTDARAVVLWAAAPPALPGLPPAFWTSLGAGAIAAGTTFAMPAGPAGAPRSWTVIGDRRGVAIDAGGAVAAFFAWDTTAAPHRLAGISRVALVAVVTRGNDAFGTTESDVARLAVRDARVGLRLVDVREPDPGTIALTAIAPDASVAMPVIAPPPAATHVAAIDLTAPPPPNAPLGLAGALPGPVEASTLAPPWDVVAHPVFDLPFDEWSPALRATVAEGAAPAVIAAVAAVPDRIRRNPRTSTGQFTEARFATPTAVTAPEMRAFLTRKLARASRLLRVGTADVALALRGGRAGEITVTAAGTAATDDDFAVLALARLGDVASGVPQRFSVRVWNTGDVDVPDATVRFYRLDPAVAPAAVVLGPAAPPALAVLAGRSAIASVEDTVAGEVVVVAQVSHAGDPEAVPPAFATWEAVLAWIDASAHNAMRLFMRRA